MQSEDIVTFIQNNLIGGLLMLVVIGMSYVISLCFKELDK